MSYSKSVNQILNASSTGLSQVLQRATQLNRLNNTLQNLLDSPLKENIYVANVRDTTLVIGTESAVWHSRAKYLGSFILEQVRGIKGWEFLQRIEFRVQPPLNPKYQATDTSPNATSSDNTTNTGLTEVLKNAIKKQP